MECFTLPFSFINIILWIVLVSRSQNYCLPDITDQFDTTRMDRSAATEGTVDKVWGEIYREISHSEYIY